VKVSSNRGYSTVNLLNQLLLGINLFFVVIAGYAIAHYGLGPAPEGWEWADLVLIMLVALSVILAALTLFLAALAIWGYTQLRHDAREQAAKTAREEVPQYAEAAARRQAQAWLHGLGEDPTNLANALRQSETDGDGSDQTR
jgi:hypothetical protein